MTAHRTAFTAHRTAFTAPLIGVRGKVRLCAEGTDAVKCGKNAVVMR